MLSATSLACAVAENIAMHRLAPYKDYGHDVDRYAEVSGESGKEDKGRDSLSYWGETAALLHVGMGEAAAPTTIMELKEVDIEIQVEAAVGEAEPADAGTAPSVEKVIGKEPPVDSKTYLNLKDAIDALPLSQPGAHVALRPHGPNGVCTPDPKKQGNSPEY
jgi:hypothetical protein